MSTVCPGPTPSHPSLQGPTPVKGVVAIFIEAVLNAAAIAAAGPAAAIAVGVVKAAVKLVAALHVVVVVLVKHIVGLLDDHADLCGEGRKRRETKAPNEEAGG